MIISKENPHFVGVAVDNNILIVKEWCQDLTSWNKIISQNPTFFKHVFPNTSYILTGHPTLYST